MQAKDFVCADSAGLALTELNGKWAWIGTDAQWKLYQRLLDWVNEYGSYAHTTNTN